MNQNDGANRVATLNPIGFTGLPCNAFQTVLNKYQSIGKTILDTAWLVVLPSGKHTKNYGKSLFLMGKLTINDHFQ
jgi:hypothetical protein